MILAIAIHKPLQFIFKLGFISPVEDKSDGHELKNFHIMSIPGILLKSFNESRFSRYTLMKLEVIDQLLVPGKIQSLINSLIRVLLPFQVK
jgi:hypothetical protein